MHHFQDRAKALAEIIRVVGTGPVVLFTFDPTAFGQFWLARYFPQLGKRFAGSVSLGEILSEIRNLFPWRKVTAFPFPLPRDLQDKFGAASWGRPEAYLEADVRNGISDFALMPEAEIETGLRSLAEDLASGQWDRDHGPLRTCETHEVGYHFITIGK